MDDSAEFLWEDPIPKEIASDPDTAGPKCVTDPGDQEHWLQGFRKPLVYLLKSLQSHGTHIKQYF